MKRPEPTSRRSVLHYFSAWRRECRRPSAERARVSGPFFLVVFSWAPRAGKSRETKERIRLRLVEYERPHHLADGRAHLEAVSRAAADDPDVRRARMPIDQVVGVGRRFVL